MDIGSLFNTIIGEFNDEQRCGLCWNFIFGGRSDYFNLAKLKPDEQCCVQVGILDVQFDNGYDQSEDFSRREYRQWSLQIFAGIPSKLDIQFYNELPGHTPENSKWARYLYPVACCMDEVQFNLCDQHHCCGEESTIEIWSWRGQMQLNYQDQNLDGWLFRGLVREYFETR